MKKLFNDIKLVQDKATRDALMTIAEELQRIRSIESVTNDVKSLSTALNKITGKIK